MTMGVRGLGKMMDEIIGEHWIIYTGTEIAKNWDRIVWERMTMSQELTSSSY